MKVRFIDCGPNIRDHWLAIKPSYPVPVDVNTEQSPTDLAGLLTGYDVCITDHTRLDAALLEGCSPTLKHIVYFGTGAASVVDLPVAERLGIQVHTIRNYGDRTVAEHTIALLMAAARQIGAQHASLRAGRWLKLPGIELKGKTLGIVGLGAIGREVASIGSALGLDVLGWSRKGQEGPHWRSVPLDTLLAEADIVTLHLALNEHTHHFLNTARFAQMKPGAMLVNTARGALVDEHALLAALRSGAVGHAALDVFEHEPLAADSVWVDAPNVTLTAHCGYWTTSATRNQVRMVLDIVSKINA
ncbi:2-hydroxyacid dehydrogenase [Paraburkholderia sp.]|uniref:2-hydroxyacid dehydrogenase n=1 Tax=Paraburkholderia sp. TaxID=1926495 RepID=UPI0039E58FD3